MLERIVGRVRRHLVAIVVAIVALGGTTLAVAASEPGGSKSGSRIYACVTEAYSTLNLSSASARCPSGQRKISWSASGKKGARGARGAQGPAGAQGAAGAAGPQGAAGPAGEKGAAGAQGADGATGAQGPQGLIGPAGLLGPVGPQGPAGPIGPTGPQGAVGPQGPAGEDGEDGAVGPQGPIGPIGPVGPQGVEGDVGPQGDVGPAGPQGPIGPAGPVGAQGPAGVQAVVQADYSATIGPSASRSTIIGWSGPSVESLDGFDPDTGEFTAPQAGTYEISYDATAGPSSAVTISTGANTWFALTLDRNGVDLFERRFPVLDVNVALVLTLRAPLREASVSASRYVTLAAGDVVALDVTNGFSIPMVTNVSLSIARVS